MKRSDLERYLGKYVDVRLVDGSLQSGILQFSRFVFDGSIQKKWYTTEDSHSHFRCSHVLKINSMYGGKKQC